jgi:hypothetical protein
MKKNEIDLKDQRTVVREEESVDGKIFVREGKSN